MLFNSTQCIYRHSIGSKPYNQIEGVFEKCFTIETHSSLYAQSVGVSSVREKMLHNTKKCITTSMNLLNRSKVICI
jgi:hypothetical protein